MYLHTGNKVYHVPVAIRHSWGGGGGGGGLVRKMVSYGGFVQFARVGDLLDPAMI